jgi:pantoate--beta-alanine ligase
VEECDRTVVSIFVNPTQFGETEDLGGYPRRVQADCELLEQEGVDLAFVPSEKAMYPPGACTWVVQEELTDKLCGAFRPGHFRGVLTVVMKLLHISMAHRAYFGRKDFQQAVLIRRMVRDLNVPTRIRVMPTVREKDGLAVSSRNEYLTDGERTQAVCLFEAFSAARRRYEDGEKRAEKLIESMKDVLAQYPDAEPEYVEIVDRNTLNRVDRVDSDSVAAMAVHLGGARLIDNMPFAEWNDVFIADQQ